MQAEIITIGDEILIGQIVDSNSAYIAKNLNAIGVSVFQITSVQDDRKHILESLAEAEARADIIIMTGGLGPTKDDITKNTIAEYFEDELVRDQSVLRNIEELWRKYIRKPLSQINIDQALVPSKSTVLMNRYGSAPGMWLEKDGKVFISLPGVPFEMKALMINEVLPRIKQSFHLPYIKHRTLLTYGLGESVIANRIESWEDALPDFIKLAYLPNLGKVRLRISGKGYDKEKIDQEIDRQINMLLPMISDIFYGYEDDSSLEEQIGKEFVKRNFTLCTAESCTGGKIAEQLTAYAGASKFFKGSIVSYATESKVNLLGVPEETINTYSVVSQEVALEMARKAREKFNSDFAISTTGNAGPTKEDGDAEVGTVCIGLVGPGNEKALTFEFGNHRTKVIQKAVNKALELLLEEIFKN